MNIPAMNLSLQKLLVGVVDYAGLFPPAGLPLREVVANYEQYRSTDASWMLSRLILPAKRLEELGQLRQRTAAASDSTRWSISALLPEIDAPDGAFECARQSIESFNEHCQWARVDTVEGKISHVGQVDATLQGIPPDFVVFIEMPASRAADAMTVLADTGRDRTFAKLRTGSIEADMIPSADDVAHFIRQAADRRVGMKFTAGLHHPLRGVQPLTYETNSPRATMHGFINVFLAAAGAFAQNWSQNAIRTLLDETNPDAFDFTGEFASWNNNSISIQQIERSRRDFALSFGSCSFIEPVSDLVSLGWLDSEAALGSPP